jgi:hypothetical protein
MILWRRAAATAGLSLSANKPLVSITAVEAASAAPVGPSGRSANPDRVTGQRREALHDMAALWHAAWPAAALRGRLDVSAQAS